MKKRFLFMVFILLITIFIFGCNRIVNNVDSDNPIDNQPLNNSEDYESDDGCYVQNCHFRNVDDINCDNKINTGRVCTGIFYSITTFTIPSLGFRKASRSEAIKSVKVF